MNTTLTASRSCDVHPGSEGTSKLIRSRENKSAGHITDCLGSVHCPEKPNSPIKYGHQVIAACYVANISYCTGRKITFDDVKRNAA